MNSYLDGGETSSELDEDFDMPDLCQVMALRRYPSAMPSKERTSLLSNSSSKDQLNKLALFPTLSNSAPPAIKKEPSHY
jgi:hypothetical protein